MPFKIRVSNYKDIVCFIEIILKKIQIPTEACVNNTSTYFMMSHRLKLFLIQINIKLISSIDYWLN